MSTGAIVAIAIGAVVLLTLFVLLAGAARRRRLDTRRERAGELREEAHTRGLHASRERAATAAERAQVAERERRFARERHDEAAEVDPDVRDPEAARSKS